MMSTPTPEEFQRLRAEGYTIEEIAHIWHFETRDSVYLRLKKWRADGLLPEKENSDDQREQQSA